MTEIAESVGFEREREQFVSSERRILGKGAEELDQEARDLAGRALSRVSSHEVLCTERWNVSRASQERMELQLSKLSDAMNSRVGWIPASIIALLTAAVGWLGHPGVGL